jgi:hypothetical protein
VPIGTGNAVTPARDYEGHYLLGSFSARVRTARLTFQKETPNPGAGRFCIRTKLKRLPSRGNSLMES